MAPAPPQPARFVVATPDLRLHLYSTPTRSLAALLVAVSLVSVPAITLLVLVANDPPVLPPVLARLFLLFTVAPAAGAWLVGRRARVRAFVDGDDLVFERADLRVAVPRAAIAGVRPWALPLPSAGMSVWLRSGRRLRWSLAAGDLAPVLTLLSRTDAAHPTVVWASARARWHPAPWYRVAGKFPLFGLLPTITLVTTHQWIAYGGPLGQVYLEGLGAYLATFAVYWQTITIYLVLYAGLWRGLVEAVCLAGAWLAPARAAATRTTMELIARVAYFAGVPAMLALRYLG